MSYFNIGRFNLLPGEITVRNNPVTFGGRALTGAVPYAHILDVRIGAPAIETMTITPGVSPGALFARNRHKTRIIEMDIELPLNRDAYPDNVHRIRAWASGTEPKRLELSAYKGRYIMASCTNLNDISLKTWWMPVTVRFECWEAYFVTSEPQSAQIGDGINVQGDAEALASIRHEISGSLTDPEWALDGGQAIRLSGTFTGGTLTIDLNRQSVYYNGESAMNRLTLSSRFFSILPGEHRITGPEGGIITWYERWL